MAKAWKITQRKREKESGPRLCAYGWWCERCKGKEVYAQVAWGVVLHAHFPNLSEPLEGCNIVKLGGMEGGRDTSTTNFRGT